MAGHSIIFLVSLIFVTTCKSAPLFVNDVVAFTHSTQLDTSGEVSLKWSYNETFIIFQLSVNTSGWVGMGIAPRASMAGADIAVIWPEDGNFVIKDMFAEYNGLPMEDESHDLVLLSGEVKDDKTTVEFGRKLMACDEHDNDISEDTLRIIYAYGDTIPQEGSLASADKHLISNRGSKSIRLLNKQLKKQQNDDGSLSMEITNNNVEIPAVKTYYHCRQHKIEFGEQKMHIVQVDPIVHPGNELLVHHFSVYHCSGLNSTTGEYGHACFEKDNAKHYSKCHKLMFAWAIGGGSFIYPSDVGFPLDDINEPLYIMIEMHFDNQDLLEGVLDSSGIRIHYTPELRDIDAGIMEVGESVDAGMFIPAGATRWRTFAECEASCLTDSFADEQKSIKIFAVLLHSHLLGKELILHHYRGGVELKPISSDKYYDFDYQEYNYMVEMDFKVGDSLAMECIYDNSKNTKPVYGGLATAEEMCVAFIQYYPKIDTFACWSSPDPVALANVFDIPVNESTINDVYTYHVDFLPKLHEAVASQTEDWKSLNGKILSSTYKEHCNVDVWTKQTKNRSLYLYPPYSAPEKDCNSSSLTEVHKLTTIFAIVAALYFIKL